MDYPIPDPIDLQGFLTIFTFETKRDLERYSKNVVLHGRDLVWAIKACGVENFPLRHRAVYRDWLPMELLPTEQDRKAIQENGLGLLKPQASKVVRKLFQLTDVRRHVAAHFFYHPGSA